MTTYTHIGFRRESGHVHSGRLYGHADYSGKRHALNGGDNLYSGAGYKALCGRIIVAEYDGGGFNVWPRVRPAAPGAGVTCRRCRKLIEAAAKAEKGA